ncbi:MAG TPA: LCCL domain-containing protein [Gemmataceae bacterium]|nr:LCCL domain-containing protein [Gemmataceae bacterium]
MCKTLLITGMVLLVTSGAGRAQLSPTGEDKPEKPLLSNNNDSQKPNKERAGQAKQAAVEVRFIANTSQKVRLRNQKLELITPHGTLVIPIADIQRIEFATRISDEDGQRIALAIADLGSRRFQARRAATAELLKMGEKAYPALLQAAKDRDPEVQRRAADLLDKLREAFPEEELLVRKHDVVYTVDSKITGRISTTVLKVDASSGAAQLKIAELRSLLAPSADDFDVAKAAPDPGNLTALQNQIGKTFVFKVTGAATGGWIWGTNVYTSDSTLAIVAVHAGIVKPGKTGVVKVTIVAPLAAYEGSTRNGVTSQPYGPWGGAYRVKK